MVQSPDSMLYSQLKNTTPLELLSKENVRRLLSILMVVDLLNGDTFSNATEAQDYILGLCITLEDNRFDAPIIVSDKFLTDEIYTDQIYDGGTNTFTMNFNRDAKVVTKTFNLNNPTQMDIYVSIQRILEYTDLLRDPYSISYMLQSFFGCCIEYDAKTDTYSVNKAKSELFFRRFIKIISIG